MQKERIKTLWSKGIQLMVEKYSWAEAILQVMREDIGLEPAPYQWATVGYMGAIMSGRTICGILFGGTVYLGYLLTSKLFNQKSHIMVNPKSV